MYLFNKAYEIYYLDRHITAPRRTDPRGVGGRWARFELTVNPRLNKGDVYVSHYSPLSEVHLKCINGSFAFSSD